jgi:hypothetical protein
MRYGFCEIFFNSQIFHFPGRVSPSAGTLSLCQKHYKHFFPFREINSRLALRVQNTKSNRPQTI